MRKTNEKVKDVEVLQRANWNNIKYIYKRKIAVEMYKIVMGAEEHRLEASNIYIRGRLLLRCIRSLWEQKSID